MPGFSLAAGLFLSFIVVQRFSELLIARRNTKRLLRQGAREIGAGHYPVMVVLHAAWLLALIGFGYNQPVSTGWLLVFAGLQMFRIWILISLGERWTTRIIILDRPLVTSGPFAYLKHPNYCLVVAEIFVAPMVLGLLQVAILFSVLNAVMLYVRIRVEERGLTDMRK